MNLTSSRGSVRSTKVESCRTGLMSIRIVPYSNSDAEEMGDERRTSSFLSSFPSFPHLQCRRWARSILTANALRSHVKKGAATEH